MREADARKRFSHGMQISDYDFGCLGLNAHTFSTLYIDYFVMDILLSEHHLDHAHRRNTENRLGLSTLW